MPEVVAEYKVNVQKAVDDLNKLAKEWQDVDEANKKANKTAEDGFLKGSDGAKRFNAELQKQPKTLAELELKLQRLKELLRDDTKIGTDGFKKVSAEIKNTEKAIDKANGKLEETGKKGNSLISQFKKLGTVLGIAFGVQQIVQFGKEAVEVAAKGEGIRKAFDKLNEPNLLANLRAATRGTVTDLDLMQHAVKANNFKIPLDQLAKYFAFATNRSIETGESIDDLVNRVVIGIGRKSVRVLDDLGFSLQELQDEVKKTGDFASAVGNIIDREFTQMGNVADTTSVKIAQLSATWDNFKASAGNVLINITDGFLKTIGVIREYETEIRSLQQTWNTFSLSRLTDELETARVKVEVAREDLDNLQDIRFELDPQVYTQRFLAISKQLGLQKEIVDALEEEVKVRRELIDSAGDFDFLTPDQVSRITKASNATKDQIKNVAFYKQLIQQLTEEQERENTTLERNAVLNTLIADATEKLNALLGKETQALKDLKKALDAIAKEPLDIDPDEILSDEDYIALGGRIDKLGDALQEAFGQEGSAKIQSAHDEWLQSQLAAMDEAEGAAEEYQKNLVQLTTTGLDALGSFASGISTIVQQGITRDMNEIQRQYDAGEISREQFEKKQRDLQRQSAQAAKDAALFQAIIGTSQAVINALATTGVAFPVAVGFAALAAAQGAIQIAAIANEPLPAFKDGGLVREHGLLKGKSHAQGGIAVEAEGNEYFMPTAPTMKNLGLLEAMRKGVEEKYIMEKYVMPKIDGALLNGWSDIGKSMELNNITANLKDHNIIASQDRMRQSMTYGLSLVANKLDKLGKRNSRAGW